MNLCLLTQIQKQFGFIAQFLDAYLFPLILPRLRPQSIQLRHQLLNCSSSSPASSTLLPVARGWGWDGVFVAQADRKLSSCTSQDSLESQNSWNTCSPPLSLSLSILGSVPQGSASLFEVGSNVREGIDSLAKWGGGADKEQKLPYFMSLYRLPAGSVAGIKGMSSRLTIWIKAVFFYLKGLG